MVGGREGGEREEERERGGGGEKERGLKIWLFPDAKRKVVQSCGYCPCGVGTGCHYQVAEVFSDDAVVVLHICGARRRPFPAQ